MKVQLIQDFMKSKRLAFGFIIILALTALVSSQSLTVYADESQPDIGNFVWSDVNENGIQDSGEPGIYSIPVNLYDASGTLVGTTLTDANGMYLFSGFPAGTYTVEVAIPSGYNLSPLGSGTATTDSDIDPATGQSAPITLTSSNDLNVDAGMFLDPGVLVYCDGNPFEVTNWQDTFAIPTFDPALGTLLGVEFNAYAGIRQDISFESLDAQPAVVTAIGDGLVTLGTLPDGTTIAVPLNQSVSTSVTAYDGTTDFGGTSGAFIEDLVSFNSGNVNYAAISDFIGGPGVDVDVPAIGDGNVTFTGAGNLVTITNTEASAGLCVTYYYASPAVEIIKLAGDAPDGEVEFIDGVAVVTFTYEVTNTGTTYLSDLVITDDAGTPGDTSDDFTITSAECPDLAGPLAPGETVTCTSTMEVSEDTTCVAGVEGNPTDENGDDLPGIDDPTDEDDAVVELVAPDIEIIKLAGDAPDGDVEYIGGSQVVEFTYEVTNTGDTYLSDIVITDDAGTPSDPSDDFTITSAECPGLAGPLAPGDTVTCTSSMVVSEDTTCVAGVEGNPTDENGDDLPGIDDPTDEDDAVVELADPDIMIIKLAGDAPDGDVEYIDGVETVIFTYEVTNTGDTYLSDIVITDDAGTPSDSSDDFTITSAECAGLAGPLAPGDTVTCTSSMVVPEDTTCVAGVSGNPTDENGADIPALDDPTDADDAVVELVSPGIDIVKTASIAEDGETLIIPAPGNVVFIYTVYNTGDTYLSDIMITDDAGTPGNASDDVTVTSAQCPALAGPVAPGGKVICTAILPVDATGMYTNVADADGNPTDENGNDLPGIDDPSDGDPANVLIAAPAIGLIKTVENAPDGSELDGGPGNYTFFYNVTNTGNTYLSNITITDDHGTPANTSDDVTLTSADCASLAGPLAPGATITCFTVLYVGPEAISDDGFYINTAETVGNPTNSGGGDLPGLTNPTDDDPAIIKTGPVAVSVSNLGTGNVNGFGGIIAGLVALMLLTSYAVSRSRREW